MFIYIKHGDNQCFIVNTNCAVCHLLTYVRSKVGLPKTDTIDLCDTAGTMKLFFLMKIPGNYANKFLTARNTYYVCRVARGTPGTPLQNAYIAFVPLLKDPDHTIIDALRTQCDILERSRQKLLGLQEAKKISKMESTVNLLTKKGDDKTSRKGPFHKARVGFVTTTKQKPKPNKVTK
ncbi:uncharacterized protein CXorf65 homolog [Pteronotus mesoamericanus]|uniref:uncharacterized protein CXorf65 homolog n=1 Tax=Pteronotus mesoamericanus TaxID=1884717 RepID=UPI0023EC3773|nr:uncharacterized protein CXorf65 homolog [Pteronotus parnellii mesoamericanus]